MKKTLRKNAGQVMIEMVLMMALIVGFTLFVGNTFKQQNFIAQMVSTPWKSLAGMIQNGVWGPSQDTMVLHPNNFRRVITPEGEAPR